MIIALRLCFRERFRNRVYGDRQSCQSLDSELSAFRPMPLMRRFKDNAGPRPAWTWAAGLLESGSWPVLVWHVLDAVAYLIAFQRASGWCVSSVPEFLASHPSWYSESIWLRIQIHGVLRKEIGRLVERRIPIQVFRLSTPWMRPESILAISSNSVLNSACLDGVMKPRRLASSSRGTHSCTDPRAMVKKFLRSAFVKRPLPSAIFVEIDSAARLS